MKPSELLDLCLELDKPDFQVFFNFSSHIKGVTVYIYEGGWISRISSTHDMTVYLDSKINGTLQDAANWLNQKHDEFRGK